jgi:hypothetical protein
MKDIRLYGKVINNYYLLFYFTFINQYCMTLHDIYILLTYVFINILIIKGQFAAWLYEIGNLSLQPNLESKLNETFDLYDDTIPLIYLDHAAPNVVTKVTSHLIVGVLLSPLEIIRTR